MAYTTVGILLYFVLSTLWPSSSGTNHGCVPNEFWDDIQERCSPCTDGVCEAHKTNLPKECHCFCFPDNILCKIPSPDVNPTDLATQDKVSTNKNWLMGITVTVSIAIIVGVAFALYVYKNRLRNNNPGVQGEEGLWERFKPRVQEMIDRNNEDRQPGNVNNIDPEHPVRGRIDGGQPDNIDPEHPIRGRIDGGQPDNIDPVHPIRGRIDGGQPDNIDPVHPIRGRIDGGQPDNIDPVHPIRGRIDGGQPDNIDPVHPVRDRLTVGERDNIEAVQPVSAGQEPEYDPARPLMEEDEV